VLELCLDLCPIIVELNAIKVWFSAIGTSSLSKDVGGKQYRVKFNNYEMYAKRVAGLTGRGKSDQNQIAVVEVRLAFNDVHVVGL
jgi:hypothetical protein